MNIIILVGFIIKFLLVLLQFFVELPLTQTDPAAFHNEAISFKEFLENRSTLNSINYEYKGGFIYSTFLGLVYFIFGESKILGGFLSCFIWALSAIVFKNILLKLNFNKEKITLLLFVYTFLFPISFYYTLLMLREVYLLLFVNLLILAIINLNFDKNSSKRLLNTLLLVTCTILLIIFHKAYESFFLIFIPLVFIFYLFLKFEFNFIKSYWYLVIIFSLPILHYYGFLEKVFYQIINYQRGHFSNSWIFRADYLARNDLTNFDYSFINLFSHIFRNLFNYYFQPTIFKITELKDIILFFENSFRILILSTIVIKAFNNSKKDFTYYLFLMMMVLMEFVYAQATVNWGGASRHHVPVTGLMILLLFYPKNTRSND